jgi:hypothetical protein
MGSEKKTRLPKDARTGRASLLARRTRLGAECAKFVRAKLRGLGLYDPRETDPSLTGAFKKAQRLYGIEPSLLERLSLPRYPTETLEMDLQRMEYELAMPMHSLRGTRYSKGQGKPRTSPKSGNLPWFGRLQEHESCVAAVTDERIAALERNRSIYQDLSGPRAKDGRASEAAPVDYYQNSEQRLTREGNDIVALLVSAKRRKAPCRFPELLACSVDISQELHVMVDGSLRFPGHFQNPPCEDITPDRLERVLEKRLGLIERNLASLPALRQLGLDATAVTRESLEAELLGKGPILPHGARWSGLPPWLRDLSDLLASDTPPVRFFWQGIEAWNRWLAEEGGLIERRHSRDSWLWRAIVPAGELLAAAERWSRSSLPEDGDIPWEMLRDDPSWAGYHRRVEEVQNSLPLLEGFRICEPFRLRFRLLACAEKTRGRVVATVASRWWAGLPLETKSKVIPTTAYDLKTQELLDRHLEGETIPALEAELKYKPNCLKNRLGRFRKKYGDS